jgi:hypothetical protein
MYGAHCPRPFPNGAGDTFDRPKADIASGEDAGPMDALERAFDELFALNVKAFSWG